MKKSWFTVVELLVWILIFTLWILSAYLLIYSSITSSGKSKDEIIIWNIAREKLELIRNIRDSNWMQEKNWNKLINWWISDENETFTIWYYKVASDFSEDVRWSSSVKIEKLSSSFVDSSSYVFNPEIWNSVRLCLDNLDRYTYDCNWNNKLTNIYSFIKIEPVITKDKNNNVIEVANALKISSISYMKWKWNTRYEMSTIITDWKK